ncbi:MAG: gamma-glutamylcyclotransferase family protein [Luteolibacter sp.]
MTVVIGPLMTDDSGKMHDQLSLVFVYGTLRSGGSNHFRMEGTERVAEGTVLGRLYAIDWYPGLVLDPAGDRIVGEVYAVGSGRLKDLDEFEGVSAGEEESEYRRVKTWFQPLEGDAFEAWVWEWLGEVDENRRIAHGDWLRNS